VENRPPLYYVSSVVILVGVVALIGAVGGTVEAVRDRSLGDESPQPLTLTKLLADGPGANRHVTVSDVRVGTDYLMKSEIAADKNDTYLVASPPGTPVGTPGKTLIVHVTTPQDYATATTNPEQATFTGFYTAGENLPPGLQKMLQANYPGLNLDAIPYLEVRPYKGTRGLRRGMYFALAGVPLLAAGIVGLVVTTRKPAPEPPGPKKKGKARS
jgi:hypothetical protein